MLMVSDIPPSILVDKLTNVSAKLMAEADTTFASSTLPDGPLYVNNNIPSSTSPAVVPDHSIMSTFHDENVKLNFSFSGKKRKKNRDNIKTHQLPMFLSKTFHMINRCDHDIATWSDKGDNFVVKNIEKFSSSILPQYFKHSNFSSFARQLNFYGFRKIKAEPILTVDYDVRTACYVRFFHEKFQKDKPELLRHIKRTTKGELQSRNDVESLRLEIQHLHEVICSFSSESERKISELTTDFNNKMNYLENMHDQLAAIILQRNHHHSPEMNFPHFFTSQKMDGRHLSKHVLLQQNSKPHHSRGLVKTSNLTSHTYSSGTDMMQSLHQACLTLRSPDRPQYHITGSEESNLKTRRKTDLYEVSISPAQQSV